MEGGIQDGVSILRETLKNDFRKRGTNATHQMTVQDYLEFSEVDLYLKDVVRQILNVRDDNPVGLMNQYFQSVVNYNHVNGREFEYVTASQRNRRAFAILFDSMYSELEDDEEISVLDFHHLLTKLCPDFPLEFVDQLASPLFPETGAGAKGGASAHQSITLPLGRLRQAFVIAFYYAGYLGKVRSIFADEVDAATFKAQSAAVKQNKTGTVEAVLASLPAPTEKMLSRLETQDRLSSKYKYRQIPFQVVNTKIEALESETLTFRQFLISIFETRTIYDTLLSKPVQENRAARIESACALLGLDDERQADETEPENNENTNTRNKKSSKKKK